MRRSPDLLLALALAAIPLGCSAGATSTAGSPGVTTAPVTIAPVTTQSHGYRATVTPIDDALAAQLTGVSWRAGCPVALADLRVVEVSYWDFDGAPQVGELIVHRDVADEVTRGFGGLFRVGFPIRSMQRVDAFGGSDDESMAADNTSAFNCRTKTGSTTQWSVHSYGRAIDINPVENPYVSGTTVLPPAGRAWLNRTDVRPGMIVPADAVIGSFPGWDWGGDWATPKDYQHLERP